MLVDMLQCKRKENSATQIVVNDILELAKSFVCCFFSFAKRSCNVVAHSMARAALLFEETTIFMEDCPPDIAHLVLADKDQA